MTLVAVFRPERPIIISDVLLSHIGLPAVCLTPTGVKIEQKGNEAGYQPSGFGQKTVLLHDDTIAFTGAGKMQTLRMVATDLADRIRKGMVRDELESWLKKKEPLCGSSTSAIVCWFDDEGWVVAKVGNGVSGLKISGDGVVLCCGSGVPWLKRNLIREFSAIGTVGSFDEHEMIRSLAIAETGQHLLQERVMGLRDAFGGGFQTTYFNGERFVRVSDVAFLTFLVEHDKAGMLDMKLAPPIVMQRASGGRLSFELWATGSGAFAWSEGKFLLRTRSRFHEAVVPPLLYSQVIHPPVTDLTTCEYVNIQVLHHGGGRPIGLGCFQLMGDPKLNPLRLSGKRGEEVEVELSEDVYETWRSRFTPFSPR